MKRIFVTIVELKNGWLWKEQSRTYKTAVSALKAIKRDGKRMTPKDGAIVQVITWDTKTLTGKAIVKALTEE